MDPETSLLPEERGSLTSYRGPGAWDGGLTMAYGHGIFHTIPTATGLNTVRLSDRFS